LIENYYNEDYSEEAEDENECHLVATQSRCECGGRYLSSKKCCEDDQIKDMRQGVITLIVGHSGANLKDELAKAEGDLIGCVSCFQRDYTNRIPGAQRYPNPNRQNKLLDVGLTDPNNPLAAQKVLKQEIEAAKAAAKKLCKNTPCFKSVLIKVRPGDDTGKRIIKRYKGGNGSSTFNITVKCNKSSCQSRGGTLSGSEDGYD